MCAIHANIYSLTEQLREVFVIAQCTNDRNQKQQQQHTVSCALGSSGNHSFSCRFRDDMSACDLHINLAEICDESGILFPMISD